MALLLMSALASLIYSIKLYFYLEENDKELKEKLFGDTLFLMSRKKWKARKDFRRFIFSKLCVSNDSRVNKIQNILRNLSLAQLVFFALLVVDAILSCVAMN